MNDVQRRRALILDVADRLLRHYGPQKTTVADVAREAGVGVGTVYLEFSSKDALVEELSRSRHRAVLEAMRAAASAGRPASEQLRGALDARLEAFLAIAQEGAHACDLVHCMSTAVKTAQASFHEEELALVAGVLRAGVASGELDAPDVEVCARTVLLAYKVFALPWLGGKDLAEVRVAIAAMHRLVLHGLVRRPEDRDQNAGFAQNADPGSMPSAAASAGPSWTRPTKTKRRA
jgi:AcrR family transcriptional regulator